MPNARKIAVAALSALLLSSCERAAQSVQKSTPVSQPAAPGQPVTSAEEAGSEDSDSAEPSMPSDSLVVTDTAGVDFTPEDLAAVKGTLEAQLHLDEFSATGPPPPYGKPCRFYDTTSVRQYSPGDIRYAFVRPRLIKISFAGDDHYVRMVNATAEITRLGVVQRDVSGRWQGVVGVTRDTLMFLVSSSVEDSTWKVCEKPGHPNGWNADGHDKPLTAWLPLRAVDAEQMAVAWDNQFSTPKLRQLADSVSRLPLNYVVEGNPEPKLPIIYKDICQYEGCSFGEWLTCDTARIFAAPSATAATAFVLKRGERFTAITAEMHVTQAGMVVFHRNVRIQGEGAQYFFTPADTLYPLMYGSEGGGIWYFRGQEGGGDFFFGNGDPDDMGRYTERGYDLVRPIKSEWWVRVRAKNGREGWFIPGQNIYGRQPHYEEMPKACPPVRDESKQLKG